MRLILGSLSALLLLGLFATGCGGKEGSEVNGNGNGNGSGAKSGSGPDLGDAVGTGGGLNGSGTVIDPDAACGKGTASAALSGVNMFVMFDRSSSMNQRANRNDTRWQLTSTALNAFFASREAAGLQLALRFFPHDQPSDGCNQDGCSVEACAMPLVPLGALSADAAPADAHEQALVAATTSSAPGMSGQGTPIYAALGGALAWATAQRQQTPNENSVVVLVTDGQANGCDENIGHIAALSAAALDKDGIRTYAIGLTGSAEDDMDQIARAGGTTQGIFVSDGANTQQELLDALGAIRGQVLDCDFPVPEGTAATPVNTAEVNVNFTPSTGKLVTLGQVKDAAACTGSEGWYYDNANAPERIVLCKSTCDAVTADPMAKLDILLGCATVPQVPR